MTDCGPPWFRVYKCQLCGEKWVEENEPIKGHPMRKELTAKVRAKAFLVAAWGAKTKVEVHPCRGGQMGTAIVIGVVRERSDLELLADVADEPLPG